MGAECMVFEFRAQGTQGVHVLHHSANYGASTLETTAHGACGVRSAGFSFDILCRKPI